MPQARATKCGRCGRPHSDATEFMPNGTYVDGTPRFYPYCRKCSAERSATPEARERERARKERKRREMGIPERGTKDYCVNGHLRSENVQPGRSDCSACASTQRIARSRARGVLPRQKTDRLPCGHDRSQVRHSNGQPKGCNECHRERERNRPHDPEASRRYVEKNRDRINLYRRAWRAVNRPEDVEFRRGGTSAIAYAKLISSDPCVYCGAPSAAIDHITPVAKGGTGNWENLAPICNSCNSSKGTKAVIHFMLRRAQSKAR